MPSFASASKREVVPFQWGESSSLYIPRAALTEISGADGFGKTSLVLKFLTQIQKPVVWIEEVFTVYPFCLSAFEIPFERILFIEAGKNFVWAALQILKSGLFQEVVISTKTPFKELELRRLQLASEKAQASVLLLRSTPELKRAWPISLQIQMKKKLYVLRNKISLPAF